MASNEEDYELVRALLEQGGSFHEERAALKALDRIRQNREWQVARARNNALNEIAALCIQRGARFKPDSPQRAVLDALADEISSKEKAT